MAKKPGIGERACPKCKEVIKADALICKHCRTEFAPEEVAAAKAEQSRNNRYAAFGCLGLLALLGFCAVVVGDGDGGKKTDAVSEKPGPTAKPDATAYYRSVIAAVGACDAAGSTVADAGKEGDAVGLYQAAERMEAACLSTHREIEQIAIPVTVGKKAHDKFSEAAKTCSTAYINKWSAAGTMKEALDDLQSVSKAAEVREAANSITAGTMLCVAALLEGATAAGVDAKELTG